jgi:hypothetical protein
VGIHIVDTFPAFLRLWKTVRTEPVERQIDRWQRGYLAPWPELARAQLADYAEQGLDWREVARERIFPSLEGRVAGMARAQRSLLGCSEAVFRLAQRRLNLDCDVVFVIHVGLSCGAGWATMYAGDPAVLFGLENAAEEGWTEEDTLAGLVAHELGHLAHRHWRTQAGLRQGRGAAWRVYEEGFAVHCERHILGRVSDHLAGSDPAWGTWCQAHAGLLALRYLEAAAADGAVHPFFGSWLEVEGQSQTGYFLGDRILTAWREAMDLRSMAVLECGEIDRRVSEALRRMARPTDSTVPGPA